MKRRAPGAAAAVVAPHHTRLAALESAFSSFTSSSLSSTAASSASDSRQRSNAVSGAPLATLDDAQIELLRSLLPRLSAAAFSLVRRHAEYLDTHAPSPPLPLVEPVDAVLARRVAHLETEAASLSREIRTARSQVRILIAAARKAEFLFPPYALFYDSPPPPPTRILYHFLPNAGC